MDSEKPTAETNQKSHQNHEGDTFCRTVDFAFLENSESGFLAPAQLSFFLIVKDPNANLAGIMASQLTPP